MRAIPTSLAALALWPLLSLAQAAEPAQEAIPFFMSGGALAEACQLANTDELSQVACVLYVIGAVDVLNQDPSTRVCVTLTTTRVEIAGVMIAWLKQHPEQNASPAGSLVRLAMKEAYPCS